MINNFIPNIKHSYKILKPFEFEQFNKLGIFKGTLLDKSHGFIHLCKNSTQTLNTLNKFYNFESILIVKFPNDKLTNLKFEQNKPNGDFYPHLYSNLRVEQIDDIYFLDYNKNFVDDYNKKKLIFFDEKFFFK